MESGDNGAQPGGGEHQPPGTHWHFMRSIKVQEEPAWVSNDGGGNGAKYLRGAGIHHEGDDKKKRKKGVLAMRL